MIDARHCKVYPHAARVQKAGIKIWSALKGLNTKIHLAVDANGMLVIAIITSDTVADCTQATGLIDSVIAEKL